MERISVSLSICLASSGMTSLSEMPGTIDLIGLNSPRTFEGASGFGSQISMWLGPPWRKTRMTDLARPQPDFPLALSGAEAALACKRRTSARLTPRMPAPPTRRNSRRLKPSHVLPDSPGIEIIVCSCVKLNSDEFMFVQIPAKVRTKALKLDLRNDKRDAGDAKHKEYCGGHGRHFYLADKHEPGK